MTSIELNIVVAHSIEAKPLLKLLRMKKCTTSTTFPLYKNDQGECLIVSGMGKIAAAAATAYLAARQENEKNNVRAWLNIGIAGHQNAELGSGVLAQKLTDYATGRSFYPPMSISGINTSDVITVDKPELEYPLNAAYEMEATGFYSSASRFVTSELVQVFKIISDNPRNHVHNVNLDMIPEWISSQEENILMILGKLKALVNDYNRIYQLPDEYHQLSAKCRFSATQIVQLKKVCQRYIALGLQKDLQSRVLSSCTTAKLIITGLESGLADQLLTGTQK
ncbi:MAG: hypothetical protein COA96_08800 [SAR86 cluster bacterium]|uniref:Nucleoside phosphorylase domain-containing protein n=1 Tax=SAR86 cluster bacterium TaxID=2030880 RepID=A0A2A5AZQ9_9GAMM|nr:MAG: hypothetical protein COA96_08800 [SAR86 cluster bacterium]